MSLIDRVFKSKIDEEVQKRSDVLNVEMAQKIQEVESRMVEVSEKKSMEKAQELHTLWLEDMEKANVAAKKAQERITAEEKTLLNDPFQLLNSLQYKERPMMLTYDVLRSMSERNPVVAAVLGTRVNQVASFSSPPKTKYDIGFRVHMVDDEATPTKQDQAIMKELEHFIENTGVGELLSEERDNFDTFLRKVARDSLTYDQMTFEIINGRGNFPIAFLGIDAATIRLASTPKFFKNIYGISNFINRFPEPLAAESKQKDVQKPEEVRYVQLLNGKVVTTYNEQEMGFGIRNPRTSVKMNGYGVSELEILINTVTAHLWAEEYNRRFFSQGSAPKGIIHFDGNITQEQLTDFRRQWHAQVMGVFNAWKTPVIAAPAKLQYQNLQMTNKQMEYSAWIDYLIKITCAVFLIDPAEIGFEFRGGASSSTAPLFESRQEAKQKMSKDRGLKPLLKFIQSEINKNIIFRMHNGRYEFEFIGLDSKTEEQIQDMRIKEIQNFKTIDEVRAEYDMPKLGHDRGGDVIMNSAYLNYLNQLQMQKLQSGMGGDESEGGGMDFGGESGGEEDGGEPDFGKEKDFGQEQDFGREQ